MPALPDYIKVSPRPFSEWSPPGDDTFELDETFELVYRNVAENPNVSTEKVAMLIELDEAVTSRVIDRLAGLRLITREADYDGWTAIEPEVALAALLARQQAGLARHQQRVEDSRLMVARLLSAWGQHKRAGPAGIEWLIGGPAVWARLAEFADECREESLSLRPAGQLTGKSLDSPRAIDEGMLARGVRSRSIVLDSARNDKPTMAYLRWETGAGGEVCTLPTLPARVWIFDRRYALIPVTNLTGVAGALAVSCDAIVQSFVTLFSMLWADAEPLTDCRPRRHGALSPQEVHILKLWAQGHTDASAARRMQVSLRTVRRLSDRLTERFGAHSRFQLGAAAMALQLIDPVEVSLSKAPAPCEGARAPSHEPTATLSRPCVSMSPNRLLTQSSSYTVMR
jgi:DNA-binding CsgD family transcriptional regulator